SNANGKARSRAIAIDLIEIVETTVAIWLITGRNERIDGARVVPSDSERDCNSLQHQCDMAMVWLGQTKGGRGGSIREVPCPKRQPRNPRSRSPRKGPPPSG